MCVASPRIRPLIPSNDRGGRRADVGEASRLVELTDRGTLTEPVMKNSGEAEGHRSRGT